MTANKPSWYEFFAGGGMARLGLGADWNCTFSNEWSIKKAETYRTRFGNQNLRVCDIAKLTPEDLPGVPALAWASFPCQDLSLAGTGAGLDGKRSGTFRSFTDILDSLAQRKRAPQIIVLENVVGTLTSHAGRDFEEIVSLIVRQGYRIGALVIDAVRFLPHSRPRLFFIAIDASAPVHPSLSEPYAGGPWHTKSLRSAFDRLPAELKQAWVWWSLPVPTHRVTRLSDLIEDEPTDVKWHSVEETKKLIAMMSPINRQKLLYAKEMKMRLVGTVYRRTRPNADGTGRSQRAEIRFDDIAGCLRTPAGGSSRQTIVVVHGDSVRSRLLTAREAARLMGVPEDYVLPASYNDAYHLLGDGVAVPVVSWLSRELLMPLASAGLRAAA
jgi:DNA (cytosine-5)-methyltransferase 1